jgi:orotidine-5'-phosphate decarboxylase
LAKDAWILCPGVGAQGGQIEPTLLAGLRKEDFSGLLVSVSRYISDQYRATISGSPEEHEVNDSIQNRCEELVNEINFVREKLLGQSQDSAVSTVSRGK